MTTRLNIYQYHDHQGQTRWIACASETKAQAIAAALNWRNGGGLIFQNLTPYPRNANDFLHIGVDLIADCDLLEGASTYTPEQRP